MEHTQAIEGKFTERYLLGELTPAERDRFEEHYFDCASCAADVEAGAAFIDNTRAVLREETLPPNEAPKEARKGAFTRYGLPFQSAAWAFVLLLCVTGYENIVTIPQLRRQTADAPKLEFVPTVSLVGAGSRSAADAKVAPAGKSFAIDLEIPGGPQYSGYVCEIRDAGGTPRISIPVSGEEAKNMGALTIPGSTLTPGRYELSVTGNIPGKAAEKLIQAAIQVQ